LGGAEPAGRLEVLVEELVRTDVRVAECVVVALVAAPLALVALVCELEVLEVAASVWLELVLAGAGLGPPPPHAASNDAQASTPSAGRGGLRLIGHPVAVATAGVEI